MSHPPYFEEAMQEKDGHQRDWIVAGLRVAVLFAPIAGIAFFRLPIPESIGTACLLFLSLPGGLLLLPFIMKNIHDVDTGFFLAAIFLNWLFYTSLLRWLISRRRRRKTATRGR
jgi:hypothetical protein